MASADERRWDLYKFSVFDSGGIVISTSENKKTPATAQSVGGDAHSACFAAMTSDDLDAHIGRLAI